MAAPHGPRGQGRARVIHAALEMFAVHGVSGTSLQMIADHLGVTKAAVYYQFKAKEEIVLAVLEPAFDGLRAVVAAADATATPGEALEVTVEGLVDLMIEQREVVATLFRDPEVQRIVESQQDFQELSLRLTEAMVGTDPSPRRRVAASMFGAGLANAGMDPLLTDIDAALLREHVLDLGRALFAESPVPAHGG